MTKLKGLYLRDTKVTPTAVEELQKVLKNTSIHYDSADVIAL